MTPAEMLELLGAEARATLCAIVTEMLDGADKTTTEPSELTFVFMHAGPELNRLTWYDLLRAAAEVVSNGSKTIRPVNSGVFRTEVLGPARYLAVLPAEGAPERVSAGDTYDLLYYSGSKLEFRRELPRAA